MKKLLILALLFWGCDYAPTEHTHDEFTHTHDITHEHDTEHTHEGHYFCTDHTEYKTADWQQIYTDFYNIDTLTVVHAPNVSEADSICLKWHQDGQGWIVDTTWCECEQGIPREF